MPKLFSIRFHASAGRRPAALRRRRSKSEAVNRLAAFDCFDELRECDSLVTEECDYV
jgi:hypothetical protein